MKYYDFRQSIHKITKSETRFPSRPFTFLRVTETSINIDIMIKFLYQLLYEQGFKLINKSERRKYI